MVSPYAAQSPVAHRTPTQPAKRRRNNTTLFLLPGTFKHRQNALPREVWEICYMRPRLPLGLASWYETYGHSLSLGCVWSFCTFQAERRIMLDPKEECVKTTTFFPGNPLLDLRGGQLKRHTKSPLQCNTRLGMGPVWDRMGRAASSGRLHVSLLGRALPHTRHPGLFSR